MSFTDEFETVELLLTSEFKTRGIDAFSLSVIKTERQVRKIFTHLIYQFPSFSEEDKDHLKETLAKNKKVYFNGFIKGFNAIYPKTIKDIFGANYDSSIAQIKKYIGYRNKIFHGQLTGEGLSRDDLIGFVYNIKEWCSTLAENMKEELGYDGFARNSQRKSQTPEAFSNLKVEIKSIEEYKDFIKKNMQRRAIGILAYGSLIDDQGHELKPLIVNKMKKVKIPFKVEFARTSKNRDHAPTLIPVEEGGSSIRGTILILNESVTLEQATDLLWRRETRNESTDEHYGYPPDPGKNHVVIEKISNFKGIDIVLYTKIGPNIENLTPANLAKFAIQSVKGKAGIDSRDGINYLILIEKQGINTPLMQYYKNEILQKTGTSSLKEALKKINQET